MLRAALCSQIASIFIRGVQKNMLSTNYFVHLILDHDHDVHYTDNMLCLKSNAYLWYKLRTQYGFNVIVFAEKTDDGDDIDFYTWDEYSNSLLGTEKKKLFGAQKKQTEGMDSIQYNCVSMENIGFDYILKFTKKNEVKKNRIAFVMSIDALNYLYRNSDEKTIEKLRERIKSGEGYSILAVKVPPKPYKISQAFLKEDSVLPKISDKVNKALSGEREPVMEVLERHMKEQIVCSYQIDDVLNMLISRAFKDEDWSMSLEEMKEAAYYIEICYNYYGRIITEPTDPGVSVFVKHSELYEDICSRDFIEKVREQINRLKEKYPAFSIKDAMKIEKLIPETPCKLTEVLQYDEPIVRNIKALSIPSKFKTFGEWKKWNGQLDQIKRDFGTFWNKPLNSIVLNAADKFYNFLKNAFTAGDKDMIDTSLKMLQFCGEQLCASDSDNKLIKEIVNVGENILKLTENINTIVRRHSTLKKVTDAQYIGFAYEYFTIEKKRVQGDIERTVALSTDQDSFIAYVSNRSTAILCMEDYMSELKTHKISHGDLEKYFNDVKSKAEVKSRGLYYENNYTDNSYGDEEFYDYREGKKDKKADNVNKYTSGSGIQGNDIGKASQFEDELLDDDDIGSMWLDKTIMIK